MDRIMWVVFLMISMISVTSSQSDILNKEDIPPQEINNLLQGRTYTPTYRHIKGTQYLTDNWKVGSVLYMDRLYEDIPIWYDTYNDELILLDWQGYGYGYIKIVKQHIQEFSFDGRKFVNPIYGDYSQYGLGDNFLELMIDDQISYLIKRDTDLREIDNKYDFVRKDKKLIIKDGVAHEINKKKALLKVVGPVYKKQVSTYIKKNINRMSKATELEWSQVILYYNNLLQQNRIN